MTDSECEMGKLSANAMGAGCGQLEFSGRRLAEGKMSLLSPSN
jgi:hypothetical protein